MLASFHLNVPPTLGTICLVWNCGQVGKCGDASFNRRDNPHRSARSKFKGFKGAAASADGCQAAARKRLKNRMGKGCRGITPHTMRGLLYH
jgi:hypothetical protein